MSRTFKGFLFSNILAFFAVFTVVTGSVVSGLITQNTIEAEIEHNIGDQNSIQELKVRSNNYENRMKRSGLFAMNTAAVDFAEKGGFPEKEAGLSVTSVDDEETLQETDQGLIEWDQRPSSDAMHDNYEELVLEYYRERSMVAGNCEITGVKEFNSSLQEQVPENPFYNFSYSDQNTRNGITCKRQYSSVFKPIDNVSVFNPENRVLQLTLAAPKFYERGDDEVGGIFEPNSYFRDERSSSSCGEPVTDSQIRRINEGLMNSVEASASSAASEALEDARKELNDNYGYDSRGIIFEFETTGFSRITSSSQSSEPEGCTLTNDDGESEQATLYTYEATAESRSVLVKAFIVDEKFRVPTKHDPHDQIEFKYQFVVGAG